ncbi:unnamed protein product [Oikopleura dioica]|uniref:Uncharacterized protein n=1 Tax=Oikopleura dioica TaxID=34765 RepID=E4WY96_OIKDI|nr:unnamed protein product [Oikopleura dioica]
MSYSNSVLADDLDRESFAAENEVLSKSGRAFSRSYARRNTLLAGDLIEEMNWRKSTLLIGRCGFPPPKKSKSWKTRLLNRLFGDIKGANHILIAVASCITTFLALINIIFFLQENQIYKEFVLPWIYVLDGLSVLAFMTVFVGYFQLGRNRTIFLILTTQLAFICLFVCLGLAYYNIAVIIKKMDNKLVILALLEICCAFGFLLFAYISFQIQFVIRRVLYDEEVYGISTSKRPTMIEQLIMNVDNTVTSSVLLPSQQGPIL